MIRSEMMARVEKLLARTANHDHIQGIGINERDEVFILTEIQEVVDSSMMVQTAAGWVPVVTVSRHIKDPDAWEPVS